PPVSPMRNPDSAPPAAVTRMRGSRMARRSAGGDNNQPSSAGNAMTGPRANASRHTMSTAEAGTSTPNSGTGPPPEAGNVESPARTAASATNPPTVNPVSTASADGTSRRHPRRPRSGRAKRRIVVALGRASCGSVPGSIIAGHVDSTIGDARDEFLVVRGEQDSGPTFLLLLEHRAQPLLAPTVKVLVGLVEDQ